MQTKQTVTIANKVELSGRITLNDTETVEFATLTFAEGFDPKARIVEVCKTRAEGNAFHVTLRTPGSIQGFRLPKASDFRRGAFNQSRRPSSPLPLKKLAIAGFLLGAALMLVLSCGPLNPFT